MSKPDSPSGEILLIHDGELADVRELLDQLGVVFRESASGKLPVSDFLAAALVISTPTYLLDRLSENQHGGAERIVVMEGDSRTLRSILARGGVEWIVSRPVHPTALRQLIVHCIYRGPEKRKTRRVSVGAEVEMQTGWRRKKAILVEISELDCRVLGARALERGTTVKLHVPRVVAGSRLTLEGTVIRCAPSEDPRHPAELCLHFDSVPAKDAVLLRELVRSHTTGPAMLRSSEARQAAAPRSLPQREPERRSLIAIGESTARAPGKAADEPPPPVDERRGDARYAFERRVMGIHREATRVLVGRDISRRGMRVDAAPDLCVGAKLKIAIHASGHETPLVLDVHVAREDETNGVLLHFGALTKIAAEYLDSVIAELGALSAGGDPGSDSGASPRMVSEILESSTG
jgi:hypothetical protein